MHKHLFLIVGSLFSLAMSQAQTGCILGDCANGKGTFVFEDGNKYEGGFSNGKINGQGTLTFANGDKYTGEWKDNAYYGFGESTGINGVKYIGQWKDGKEDGQGTLTYINGDKYIGQWKDGKMDGQGTWTSISGDKYIGQWKDDKQDGQGTYTYSSGLKYDCQWKEGKKHGQGVIIFPNGDKYEGSFFNDNREMGTTTWADGAKHIGVWKDGYRNGECTYAELDGSLWKGTWKTDAASISKLVTAPKPTLPPNLFIENVSFVEINGNSNNALDAGEKAEIRFVIGNKGRGNAFNLVVYLYDSARIAGIDYFNNFAFENILQLPAGAERSVSIPITGNLSLANGKSNFIVKIREGNNFYADPFKISIKTQAFQTPKLVLADAAFTNTEGEGKIILGKTINLRLMLQNQGQGTATAIKVNFENPQNIYPGNQTQFNFSALQPNEAKRIDYEFFANKLYNRSEIPITVTVTESYGKYGLTETKTVSLENTLSKTQQVDIASQSQNQIAITTAYLTSDVDKNIPVNTASNAHRYALVIGNEDYTKFQTNISSESNVAFAVSDAGTFAAYCEKTLGVQHENVTLLQNAIGSKMKQEIDKLSKLIQYENGNAEVIFYYAGHGFPDEATKESYIMPVDISGSNVADGIKLSDLYQKLTANPVKRVSVFLDACFSGGGRDAGLLAARSVKIKPKANAISGNLLVLSASSGEQSSLPYKDKQHGMFTYYLLKKLQETKGDVLYKDLFDYVKQEVEIHSIKVNGKDQNPQLNYSSAIDGTWSAWKVK